jgi:hypothetical protein
MQTMAEKRPADLLSIVSSTVSVYFDSKYGYPYTAKFIALIFAFKGNHRWTESNTPRNNTRLRLLSLNTRLVCM